jgi:hypothetical protein
MYSADFAMAIEVLAAAPVTAQVSGVVKYTSPEMLDPRRFFFFSCFSFHLFRA